MDESLRRHAQEYMNPRDKDGMPFIKNIYYLQALADMHIYLKTEHEFTPGEVNDLLMFADPLSVVRYCWEENEDRYCLRISDLIDKHHLRDLFPPVDFDLPEKPSLRERLDKAKQQVQSERPLKTRERGDRGGDAR